MGSAESCPVDAVPVASQIKSVCQATRGDKDGADETQMHFVQRCPLAAQITSAVQALQGDYEGAKVTQLTFLEKLPETVTVTATMASVPLAGIIVAPLLPAAAVVGVVLAGAAGGAVILIDSSESDLLPCGQRPRSVIAIEPGLGQEDERISSSWILAADVDPLAIPSAPAKTIIRRRRRRRPAGATDNPSSTTAFDAQIEQAWGTYATAGSVEHGVSDFDWGLQPEVQLLLYNENQPESEAAPLSPVNCDDAYSAAVILASFAEVIEHEPKQQAQAAAGDEPAHDEGAGVFPPTTLNASPSQPAAAASADVALDITEVTQRPGARVVVVADDPANRGSQRMQQAAFVPLEAVPFSSGQMLPPAPEEYEGEDSTAAGGSPSLPHREPAAVLDVAPDASVLPVARRAVDEYDYYCDDAAVPQEFEYYSDDEPSAGSLLPPSEALSSSTQLDPIRDGNDSEYSTYSYYEMGRVIVPRNEQGVLGERPNAAPLARAHKPSLHGRHWFHATQGRQHHHRTRSNRRRRRASALGQGHRDRRCALQRDDPRQDDEPTGAQTYPHADCAPQVEGRRAPCTASPHRDPRTGGNDLSRGSLRV